MQVDFTEYEHKLLVENEVKVNYYISRLLFYNAIIIISVILFLQGMGIYIFFIDDAVFNIIAAFILLILPRIFTLLKAHEKTWFKYVQLFLVIIMVPFVYLEYDYMVLIIWLFPLLISSLYCCNKLNIITVILNIIIFGFASYLRSYIRLQHNLIPNHTNLFNDFIVSFSTYSILVLISFSILYISTKKTNRLLHGMIKNKKYEVMSNTDSLTGIYNHRFLMNELEDKCLLYKRDNIVFSAIIFDVDYFKKINDTYGHIEGDQVLIKISQCLIKTIRDIDIIGRYGGEEFLVILPNTTKDDAILIAENCRKAVCNMHINNHNIEVSISGGVDQYNGIETTDFMKKIDEKLYLAKEQGRNRII
jgi:diguanylate cyclase (GGDEF)-like protein